MNPTIQKALDYITPLFFKDVEDVVEQRKVEQENLDLKNPKDWIWWINNGSGPIPVSPENVFKVVANYACIKAKSEDISMLGWDVLKRTANGREIAFDHDQYFLLHDQPNEETNSFDYRRCIQSYKMSWGNGVALIERNKFDRPIAYHIKHPNYFQGFRDSQTAEPYYKDFKTGEIIDPFNVIHIKGFDFGDIWAPSTATIHRHTHQIGLALDHFGASFWKNGTHLRGVIEMDDYLEDDDEIELLRDSFKQKYSGVEKTADIGILFGGAKYKVLDMNLKDAEYIAFGNHTAQVICGLHGVPPHRVGILERSTNNNIEKQHDEYVQFGLQPDITQIEQEHNRKSFRRSERGRIFNRINIRGLLRGDTQQQAEFIDAMMKWGIFELDDAREYVGVNPMKNGKGKRSFVPANYWPLDRIDEIIDKQVEQKLKEKFKENGSTSLNGSGHLELSEDLRQGN